MLLQEPGESQYDLRFQLFGFSIRISWSFWIGAFVFGFYLVQLLDRGLGEAGPGIAALYLLWALCLLVSVLIHELGHALAFRQFGIESSIVLYHFGGLAIPRDSWGRGGSYSQLTAKQDMWIAFAGPLAQLLSAALLVALIKAAGYSVSAFGLSPLNHIAQLVPSLLEGNGMDSAGLLAMTIFYIWPSIVWGLLNLIPVWPLDGGRIMKSLVLISGGNTSQSLWISLIAAALMSVYGWSNGQMFMGILFLSLAITNFQMLQQSGGWRY